MASVLEKNHCSRLSIRDHPTTLYQIEHHPVPDQKLLTDIQIDLPGSPNPKQLLYHPILHSEKKMHRWETSRRIGIKQQHFLCIYDLIK